MKVSQGSLGRVFVLRLEDGDKLPDSLEKFAVEHKVSQAFVAVLGGAEHGSTLVVGPEDGDSQPPTPMTTSLDGVHEMVGLGTIFPGKDDKPSLHLHAACGREDDTVTGCVRPGVDVWKVLEVVVLELTGIPMRRKQDPRTGFVLLNT